MLCIAFISTELVPSLQNIIRDHWYDKLVIYVFVLVLRISVAKIIVNSGFRININHNDELDDAAYKHFIIG